LGAFRNDNPLERIVAISDRRHHASRGLGNTGTE
jgi:hypothetical protein